jgi:predicted metal-binding protein
MGRWPMAMPEITLTVCTSCELGASGFADRLRAALPATPPVSVKTVECMSGCPRPSTLSVRATGKTAYLFGDLTETDLPQILAFVQLYADSPDGNFPDARVIGDLRLKALARIPG